MSKKVAKIQIANKVKRLVLFVYTHKATGISNEKVCLKRFLNHGTNPNFRTKHLNNYLCSIMVSVYTASRPVGESEPFTQGILVVFGSIHKLSIGDATAIKTLCGISQFPCNVTASVRQSVLFYNLSVERTQASESLALDFSTG